MIMSDIQRAISESNKSNVEKLVQELIDNNLEWEQKTFFKYTTVYLGSKVEVAKCFNPTFISKSGSVEYKLTIDDEQIMDDEMHQILFDIANEDFARKKRIELDKKYKNFWANKKKKNWPE